MLVEAHAVAISELDSPSGQVLARGAHDAWLDAQPLVSADTIHFLVQ